MNELIEMNSIGNERSNYLSQSKEFCDFSSYEGKAHQLESFLDLSAEEINALNKYLQGNVLTLRCKDSSKGVSRVKWEVVEAGLLFNPKLLPNA